MTFFSQSKSSDAVSSAAAHFSPCRRAAQVWLRYELVLFVMEKYLLVPVEKLQRAELLCLLAVCYCLTCFLGGSPLACLMNPSLPPRGLLSDSLCPSRAYIVAHFSCFHCSLPFLLICTVCIVLSFSFVLLFSILSAESGYLLPVAPADPSKRECCPDLIHFERWAMEVSAQLE